VVPKKLQLLPQLPQFLGSVCMSTQPPHKALSPAGQQVPRMQAPLHDAPHAPQLAGSLSRSAQPEGQRSSLLPGGQQADGPLVMVMHESPPGQAAPQLPQSSMEPV
jgi:hypothetical protein